MKILFVNGHSSTSTGKAKFSAYHQHLCNILSSTLFFGQQHEELVRTSSELQEFLYDRDADYIDPKSLQRFQLIDYIFVDGDLHVQPTSKTMRDLNVLIKMCVKYNVKCHLNRFAFMELYRVLLNKGEQEGENLGSGFYCRQVGPDRSIYSGTRVQSKLYWKSTKFHYVCNSKVTGNELLKDVNFPVILYCRSQQLCQPTSYIKSACQSLVQTQNHSPVVVVLGNILGTITLNQDFLTIIKNWILKLNCGMVVPNQLKRSIHNSTPLKRSFYDNFNVFNEELQEDNLLGLQKTLNRPMSGVRQTATSSSYFSRPKTGIKKEAFSVIYPVVRSSGPYNTEEQIKRQQQRNNSKKAIGRRYLSHSRTVDQFDIKNYVHQTPSNPPAIHEFRTVQKSKWLSNKPFYVT